MNPIQRLRSALPRRAAGVLAAAMAVLVAPGVAQAQNLLLENEFRNDVRQADNSAAPENPAIPPPDPGPNPGLRMNASTFGGWQSRRVLINDTVTAGAPDDTPGDLAPGSFLYPGNGSIQLRSAQLGVHLRGRLTTYGIGDVIPPPTKRLDGTEVPEGFFLAEPEHIAAMTTPEYDPVTGELLPATLNPTGGDQAYWSPHAQKVFATQPGNIRIRWRIANTNPVQVEEHVYTVSFASKVPVRRIYWTENGFNGPRVSIPRNRVNEVNIVYNSYFPKTVADDEIYPAPRGQSLVSKADRVRTLWLSQPGSQDGTLQAYNREGRVFLEYLGALANDPRFPGRRVHLGFEVIDVAREIAPTPKSMWVGDKVTPVDEPNLDESGLQVSVLTEVGVTEPFFHRQVTTDGDSLDLYAIRTTTPMFVNGEQVPSNEAVVYWMESGDFSILWPRQFTTYTIEWPSTLTDEDAYSVFARPSTGSQDDDVSTAVSIPSENLPMLVFQDDPLKRHATLSPDRKFSTTGNGRSLIQHQQGSNVWFERVLSRVDSDFDSYASFIDVSVGNRLEPPPGATSALAGHIRPEGGRAYHAGAYIDPLTAGFDEAAAGAIIGVNALSGAGAPDTGRDTLEVWWFETSIPPTGSGIKPVHWPSHVGRYRLSWPAQPAEIVMASNLGSGELPSLQANGSIYTQNDPALPGYNPNEEHAMAIGGTVWALRDDLNLANSSEPYALLDYVEADGRPAMKVFRVLREKDPWFFSYRATAGTVLQAPMPLPLLPLPRDAEGNVIHEEVDSAPDLPANEQELANPAYAEFTMKDRKGTTWIHRGPHDDGTPSFGMHFYYRMQPGFYFPELSASDQPEQGSNVPYLRPYADDADPSAGFAGDPVTGDPLTVVFHPAWPAAVPELMLGQTLTLPVNGLPQVRGHTSLEIFYQQSTANQSAPDADDYAPVRSAVLFDPTRAKTYAFSDDGLSRIPVSIKTSEYQGKTYFPNLPPHLTRRFWFDPNTGPSGALVLVGEFKDEVVGLDYLLPNVLSAAEVAEMKALCVDEDEDFDAWGDAIDGLETARETFIEDPGRPKTYIVDATETVLFSATEPVEITDDDQAVDSYALSATGGGTGYVVLLAGGGEAFTPEGEPVALQIVRVVNPLFRAELKGVAPSNPLDEKFTLQFSSDFAGNPGDYEFEWRYGRPTDGLPPRLYEFQRVLALGDGSWTLIPAPPADPSPLREPGADLTGLNPSTIAANAAFVIRDGAEEASEDGSPPLAILRREFNYARSGENADSRLVLSVSITGAEETPPPSGIVVWLNDQAVAVRGVPGRTDTPVTGSPGAGFSPLSIVFSVPSAALLTGTNVITLDLYTTEDAGTTAQVNARLEAEVLVPDLSGWISLGAGPGESLSPLGGVTGKNRYTVGGPGLLTLTDNYYIVRYRALSDEHAAWVDGGGWSTWTEPQLVEGWIKRALAGINPFQQRILDLYNNAVNTDVSLVTQAGKRWEGDIALNLENINATGLIEIYETILRRGRMLSIEATPPLSDSGANDALLLAAGYLSDLYMLLHNEAYADAADPTIAFGTDSGEYGTAVTSLFAFRGQVASVLDEELALLRGRDDFLQPGTRTAPYYNRLVWNYTRGIDAGEAVYALNYNIKDLSLDGIVGPEDAAQAYPQGHGDAWGHALTALTGYYSLLRNDYFSWTPRIEAVTVLGKAVSVDYQDERKFATAAAALARTASQTLSLTYRKEYSPDSDPSWENLRDGRLNSGTGITRRWGTDDWASRAGQGAYFHWITANSVLPSVDPDPSHEGIQKIDRTTVPELVELATQAAAIQTTQDTADARLNPLGLSHSALPFDVDPNFLDVGSTIQGKMYFPQIMDRALKALRNAAGAFQRAGTVTESLRRQGDSLDEQRSAILSQERAYESALVDIYGTPYPDDIGPGRTWAQGYAGPDLIHYGYVDQVEVLTAAPNEGNPDEGEEDTGVTEITFRATVAFLDETANIDFEPTLANPNEEITVTIGPRGEMVKPEEWTGRRAHPGRMQTAYSDWITARRELIEAAEDCEYAALVVDRLMNLYNSAAEAALKQIDIDIGTTAAYGVLTPVKIGLEAGARYLELVNDFTEDTAEATSEGAPTSVGFSVDAGFPVRLISRLVAAVSSLGVKAAVNGMYIGAAGIEFGLELGDKIADIEKSKSAWATENKQLLHDLRMAVEDTITQQRALDGALRRFDQAERDLRTLQSEGLRIRNERQAFRQRAAAIIHGYRTKDFAFRAFRNEALESYRILFDNAARASFLAARAYDYETGLLDSSRSAAAADFLNGIVQSRALGMIDDSGVPQFGGSATGDAGLAGLLARLNADWSVVESRLGFNNPDRYRTTFSLRTENFRLLAGTEGDGAWRTVLDSARMDNILEDEDVRRYCMQAGDPNGLAVPGFVIPFSTTIQAGRNFFGQPLAGGDNTFSPTSFATKIRASGIAFRGYAGMQSPSAIDSAASGAGAESPADPWTGFTDPTALSATPYVYLIPVGLDFMRAPALGDSGAVRSWSVEDQALPLPFNVGQTADNTQSPWQSALSLTESPFILRKHQAFRAIPDGVAFQGDAGFTNARLIGRSVWNSRWKIVIPGNSLLSDAARGTRIFADTVKDIKLHLETYSYSGN